MNEKLAAKLQASSFAAMKEVQRFLEWYDESARMDAANQAATADQLAKVVEQYLVRDAAQKQTILDLQAENTALRASRAELLDSCKKVYANWDKWCDAAGWDNNEYDDVVLAINEMQNAIRGAKI